MQKLNVSLKAGAAAVSRDQLKAFMAANDAKSRIRGRVVVGENGHLNGIELFVAKKGNLASRLWNFPKTQQQRVLAKMALQAAFKQAGVSADDVLQPFSDELSTASHDFKVAHLDEALNLKVVDENTVKVGGKAFTLGEQIGVGAFGEVFLATSADKKQTIAVKKLTERSAASMALGAREANIHSTLHGDGHPNVNAFLGAAQGPGGFYHAMACAPHGDLGSVMEKLNAARRDGKITEQQHAAIRWTLIKDMTESLVHVHQAGYTHFDVKPQNFLLGDDGQLKLIDFGTAGRARQQLAGKDINDNPLWRAPEMQNIKEHNLAVRQGPLAATKDDLREARQLLNTGTAALQSASQARADSPPKVGADRDLHHTVRKAQAKGTLAQMRLQELKQSLVATYQFDNKADIWSLGVSAFEILNDGKRPFGDVQNFPWQAAEQEIKDYTDQGGAGDFESWFRASPRADAQTARIDGFVNGCLGRKPSDRLGADSLLDLIPSDVEGIGSDATRDLMLKIAKGTGEAA